MRIDRKACIGVILPSSNRTVERVAHAIRLAYPELDICMTRVPYGGHPADGYAMEPFRAAAKMVAEAKPDVILWNATRGALLGFEPDRALCTMIEDETGIPAMTTALATLRALHARRIRRLGLIVQGTEAECRTLRHNFDGEGIRVSASIALAITDNYSAVNVGDDVLAAAASDLSSRNQLDAVLIWSTNLGGHALSRRGAGLEIPLLDSTTVGFDAALETMNVMEAKADRDRCFQAKALSDSGV